MLNALKEFTQTRNLSTTPGFKSKNVKWLLAFDPKGNFHGVQEGREFNQCPYLTLSEMKAGGKGCRHFLVDNIEVVTLFTTKEEGTNDFIKISEKHKYFISKLIEASKYENDLKEISSTLKRGETLKIIQDKLSENKAKPNDLCSFVTIGTTHPIILERDSWIEWYDTFRASLARENQSNQMRCFVSGSMVVPVKTQPKISGLSGVGGLSMGDNLISFKQPSFRSFGLEWAENSAMSEEMAETYRAALDYLIKRNGRMLSGVKVIYWYIGDVKEDEDPMSELFGDIEFGEAEVDEKDKDKQPQKSDRHVLQAESRVEKLLKAIQTGDRDALRLRDARYCALTLSGNSGRVIVRDWMEGQFEDLLKNIQSWFDDLSITSRDGKSVIRSFKLNSIIAAPVREIKEIASPHVANIWHCILKNQPISSQLMAQTLSRIKIDILTGEAARHARLGLLKAYLKRKTGGSQMTAKLNTDITDPAYLCGRIMALLASIQNRALPDVGAGIVQRYYAAASATPGLVLGRLVRLAQTGHLPKIESEGLRIWFEKQLALVWSQFEEKPPATLDLEGQTLFAMGYYQQKAKRYSDSENSDKNTTDN